MGWCRHISVRGAGHFNQSILLCFIPVSYDSKIHFYFVYLVSLITMFSRCPSIILLASLYACLLLNHQTVLSFTPSTISSARHHLQSTITQRYLFNIQSGSAKIPTSNTDRNSAAISSIKSAIWFVVLRLRSKALCSLGQHWTRG